MHVIRQLEHKPESHVRGVKRMNKASKIKLSVLLSSDLLLAQTSTAAKYIGQIISTHKDSVKPGYDFHALSTLPDR